ncbi:UDP-4-amino-4,6-dideoxy-N-acetyl-beta-L-altrosamine N-acetyltransferase [Caulobacter sp. S45]|jgi:UDP-4-amino-4,6-dideoxy-N-acetyl-beta-L-altrosamine N-acetyltransferase|uniref:UDP-4-amino-4, 6-dideoxy-N-acetyl-beta-L-altrosamine N-acetyltransferase n=1 Tax=Caulobacter sp. S45 TaxID=1641861 RepID=UPI00131ABBD3|nr:UDP-4-amino-4,6-dideoxy-N-acetyl-beta-L-altrosamine N-acetyltransferase [Caulobacter sp. S45]
MIELRDFRDEDVHDLFRWRREPEVDRWMYELPPGQFDEHQKWFDEHRADPKRRGWMITLNGAPCGFLHLYGISRTQRRAQWGWFIGEAEARGRGAGRAAQALGLDRAFSEFDLHKVWSEVPAGHETALKAQATAGFRREGYLRRHAFKNGEFRDVVLLAILSEEWAAKRDSVRRDLVASRLIAA